MDGYPYFSTIVFIRMEITKRLLLLIVLSGMFTAATAQDLFYRKNLANVRIDNLSQDQVLRFQQQVQSSNMSSQEMEAYLRSKGLSREEIAKLKKKMGRIGNTASANELYSIELMNDYFKLRDSLQNMGDGTGGSAFAGTYAKTQIPPDSVIFGSELFANSKMSFMSDLQPATPNNYVIGPGDVLNITLFGIQEVSAETKVLPDGKINLPYAGVLSAAGLTVEQLTRKLGNLLQKNGYASLGTGESKLQITVAEFRSFQVTVIGAKSPGIFLVPSVANVFHVLHLAGGPAVQNTYREIEVIRKGKIIQHIDLYSFLVSGSLEENITLQENDVINIPAFETRVHLKGEVKKQGLFELKEGESFEDLLRYSGGFNPIAFKDRIYVEQVTNTEFVTRDIDKEGFATYQPQAGDMIIVGAIINRITNRVAVGGSVMRPGYYGWEEGMQLDQLIAKAGGLKENALLTRGLVYRAGRDNSKAYLRFNPQTILDGGEPIQLEDGDSVIIGSKNTLFPDQQIKVAGDVHASGSFVFGEGMTAMDAILMAGGMSRSAQANRIEVARRQEGTGDMVIANILEAKTDEELMIKADELVLEPLDVVIIRPNPGYQEQRLVRLEGEVLYPGPYVLLKRQEKLSSVIGRAGGLTNLADPNATFIIRTSQNPFYLKAKREMQARDRISNKALRTADDEDIEFMFMREADSVLVDTIAINVSALFGKNREKYDIDLKDGDVIQVLVTNNTVAVKGQVNSELTINYGGKRLRSYLKDAGGTVKQADKKRIYVVAPNGRANATKQFMGIRKYPKVVPGSVVLVPAKPMRGEGGLDPARTAAASSILASTTGLLFVILTLVR